MFGAGLLPLALAEHDGQSLPLDAPTSTCDFHGARALDHLRVFNGTAGVPYVYACGQNRHAGTCISRILNPTNRSHTTIMSSASITRRVPMLSG